MDFCRMAFAETLLCAASRAIGSEEYRELILLKKFAVTNVDRKHQRFTM